jgi:nifR3 family TIM-barrel protein
MEEVTDVAFREMFAWYSGASLRMKDEGSKINPFVMFTEFINVDGLTHPEGRKNLSIDLKFTENQRPMVAQLWGNNPAKFTEAAKIIVDLGFDGIDINMGCPQDKEIAIGACAALIRTPKLALEIIAATKKGAANLPVSVKTRLGYTKTDEMEGWVKNLLSADIAALTLHARTKQEKSKVPAHWDKIAEAVKVRNEVQGSRFKGERTFIIGNGDIQSRAEGLQRVAETGVDGVMVGRGAFGNPWFFNFGVAQAPGLPTPEGTGNKKQAGGLRYIAADEKLRVMLEHARLFNELLGDRKSFFIMRKHFKAYASGFEGSHELRAKLLNAKDLAETEKIVEEYLKDSRILEY